MSKIIIGSARIDERGKVSGGSAGDQKQKVSSGDMVGEVSQQNFYVHSKGWYVLRPKLAQHAESIAKAMVVACDNKNLGYDQANRGGIIKYGIRSKVPTGCDCSSTVRACVREATGIDVGNFTTLTEKATLIQCGFFTDMGKYKDGMKLYAGDVLVTCTKGHTVVVTQGESRSVYYPKCSSTQSSIKDALSEVGEKDTSLSHRIIIAQANDIRGYSDDTYKGNLQMLKLLKLGKLLKA